MTTKGEILKAIRLNCVMCCGGSTLEVRNCAVGEKCTLYPFRMGKDPNPARKGMPPGFLKSNKSEESDITVNEGV